MKYLKNIMETIKKVFLNTSIRSKMLIIFMVFMLFYVIISAVIYVNIIKTETLSQVRQRSHETTELIRTNINTLIDNANNVSKMMTTSSLIRAYLASDNPSRSLTKSANEVMFNIHITFPNIDSIYLYDLYGSVLRTNKNLTVSSVEDVKAAPWFDELVKLNGGYKIAINAENTLKTYSGKNLVSVMRILNDLDSLKPIGVLVLNISQDSLSEVINETGENGGSSFIILDANNNPVIKNDAAYEMYNPYLVKTSDYEDIISIDSKRLLVFKSVMPNTGWKIISCTSLSSKSPVIQTLNLLYVFFIGITIFLFIVASLFTANFITSPIKKLINSMQGVANGVFKRVSYNTGNDEIGELKNNYNLMIMEINNLIIKLINEEKKKRKFELDVLNEQIKPHFLYNTLDNIAYLALSGNNQTVYEAVNALGSFCRISLSKGSEVISLENEVRQIQNYLLLQKLRYGEMISDEYNISPDTNQIRILKNILQPLVENSIYHGIRPSGEPGYIKTSAHINEGYLILSVEDNGVGMDEQEINSISDENLAGNQASFGLRGTIQRLKIHYGTDEIYMVESSKYSGTKITLKIPLEEGKND
ncbi:integral membrane sensor signal transduction histidine kinase [Ruminiclostridium papyrosolvens DSM 2782]|uniref:Integral membrane sensor signal transduction histidine kinase n=1 Tax=Ruminiclostridium papyrosolvens DSM 2782 TaxID=588581 RepID=F1TD21_9FIRM|nr:sensor histidine kinase [Ruminiclostridium papyrosolvens]EGD47888.1 integral membrane sensor signal transduction histidine kinase [Ruminiclostridium papyrosolvens DSM 2782]WES34601.1 sensor histidine kinase [Ruminiclostridium papyrosolvens DSM 2782]